MTSNCPFTRRQRAEFPWSVQVRKTGFILALFRNEHKARDYARQQNLDGRTNRWVVRQEKPDGQD